MKYLAINLMKNTNLTLAEYQSNFQGLIMVAKEKGMTSRAVSFEVAKLFGIKKAGHAGTLDPLATGLLIVALGRATKIVGLLQEGDKEYIAEGQLGIETDTLDITGHVIAESPIPPNLNLAQVLATYCKTYNQEVPLYSATRVQGKRLYQYARNHEKVVLPQKKVTISEIELLNQTKTTFKIRCVVSKGCYIRRLVADIGRSLGTLATMTNLKRTRQGKITLKQANTLSEIKKGQYRIYSISDCLDYPVIKVDAKVEKKIKGGHYLEDKWGISFRVIFKNQAGQILGIYEKRESDLIVYRNLI